MNKGTLVLLHGIVRGMDQEAEIEVLTRRVQDHNASGVLPIFKYVDCTVISGAADLPDGDYIASFSGCSAVVTRRNGLWLPSGIAVPDMAIPDEDLAPGAGAEAKTEPPSSHPVSKDEPRPESPALNTSSPGAGHRSFLV